MSSTNFTPVESWAAGEFDDEGLAEHCRLHNKLNVESNRIYRCHLNMVYKIKATRGIVMMLNSRMLFKRIVQVKANRK